VSTGKTVKTLSTSDIGPNPTSLFLCRRNRLAFPDVTLHRFIMRMPSEPVVFSVQQIEDLNYKLSALRHDINNNLSLIMAASELVRHKPHMAERMMGTLIEQPPKITAALTKFSAEFEQAFGILRG
jgi:hypothetical protein